MTKLSHTDGQGKARMVDVGSKKPQLRIAKATGYITLKPETVKLVSDNSIKKGDVITVAETAGIQAAKRTADLIPLCHPLQITKISVRGHTGKDRIIMDSEIRCIGQTGVEMEALTAVSIALLTIYDMCKAVDKDMVIKGIHLKEKTKTDI